MKQKVFSWGQKFDICDINGKPVYRASGEVFSIGKKLHIYDTLNNEVIYIKQKLFKVLPHYEIYINGKYVATLIKKFTILSHSFYFENLNWQIDGDFLAYSFSIKSGAENVVTIGKRLLSWGDTYDISINDNYDHLLALAACIVIDCACHEGK